jgi:hypothetical protein
MMIATHLIFFIYPQNMKILSTPISNGCPSRYEIKLINLVAKKYFVG